MDSAYITREIFFCEIKGMQRKTIIRFKYQSGKRKEVNIPADRYKKKKKWGKKNWNSTNEADNKLIFTGLIWMSKRTVCIRNPWICSSGITIKTCRNIKNTSVDLPWNYVCRSLNIYTFIFPVVIFLFKKENQRFIFIIFFL